jgi:hypothetical protein
LAAPLKKAKKSENIVGDSISQMYSVATKKFPKKNAVVQFQLKLFVLACISH